MNRLKTSKQIWDEIINSSDAAKISISAIDKSIDIINKITRARLDLGLTQAQVSEKSGLKQSAIARIESLRVIPKITTLIKIAECVNVSMNALKVEEERHIASCIETVYKWQVIVEGTKQGVYRYE